MCTQINSCVGCLRSAIRLGLMAKAPRNYCITNRCVLTCRLCHPLLARELLRWINDADISADALRIFTIATLNRFPSWNSDNASSFKITRHKCGRTRVSSFPRDLIATTKLMWVEEGQCTATGSSSGLAGTKRIRNETRRKKTECARVLLKCIEMFYPSSSHLSRGRGNCMNIARSRSY